MTFKVKRRTMLIAAISVMMLLLAIWAVLRWCGALKEVEEYLHMMDWQILLLLVPNIIMMYYAAGQIWYPYLKNYGLSGVKLGLIQYELNFVNTVLPVEFIGGLFYAQERLKGYGVPLGRAGGLYTYRYVVSITTNWIGILMAATLMFVMGSLYDVSMGTMVLMAGAICFMMALLLVTSFLVFDKKRSTKMLSCFLKGALLTKVADYLAEVHEVLVLAWSDKRTFVSTWLWGMLYTILEDIPFFIVAWALGHPELFLPMVVAAGLGIIVGSIMPTPAGIGGFDGAMILLLGGMGQDIILASTIIIMARFLVLVGTAVTGYFPWQRGMIKIGHVNS